MAATEHHEQLANAGERPPAAFVDAVLAGVPIEPYGLEVAVAHAEPLAHTRKAGRPRGAHGLADRREWDGRAPGSS